MDFQGMLNKVSPRLKKMARNKRSYGFPIDQNDLYQEMCIYLWENYKQGMPAGVNEAYIVRGCLFHILNYLRKQRKKVALVSLQEPINQDGNTLQDVLPERKESLAKRIDKQITIEDIKNNGFTRREKDVFSLLLKGYTVREIGSQLSISHVMVVKLKQGIVKRWRRKENYGYQRG